jgi:hypothetical protein
MSIPEMPEDASYDELLCDFCYSRWEKHEAQDEENKEVENE